MSALTTAPTLPADVTATRARPRGWLVAPWFDALLIANLGWPIVALAPVSDLLGGQDGVAFWQLYYVTTPHRWITLALVFLDRDRSWPDVESSSRSRSPPWASFSACG
jgi:hypothetical protein